MLSTLPVLDSLLSAQGLIALLSLAAMEIILGIDNIVFIAILSQKLPADEQPKARRIGLVLALAMRIGLLLTLSVIMRLTAPLFSIAGWGFSGRSLILLGGGLFLVAKSTHEIYDRMEVVHDEETAKPARKAAFGLILAQILALDVVFSLDSVITAVGMAQSILVMIIAMVAAVLVMLIFADRISGFINRHPSMKILALSFLLLIGVLLVAEGFGKHIEKGYVYFAMGFSLAIELLNMRMRKKQKPVALHTRFDDPAA